MKMPSEERVQKGSEIKNELCDALRNTSGAGSTLRIPASVDHPSVRDRSFIKQQQTKANWKGRTKRSVLLHITIKMTSLKGPGEAQQHDGSALRIGIVHARWNTCKLTHSPHFTTSFRKLLLIPLLLSHNRAPPSWH
jgi:hypothetical protein